ncbi:MAG TPA: ribosomal protein S18-alanine N-acetyltransferase [Acidobacteriota bacterium]|nr:ribosomal protein S18-alanine N-acetyltransferase [Acidobacteriota bacterium]
MTLITYLALLNASDISLLEQIEGETNLSFWGAENYRRFLEEFPEYFGCKAVVMKDAGRREFAGFYLARSLFENLEILKVGVYPQYQRQGIGTQLMESAYSEGIRRGCKRCFLEVRKSNQNAIQFYNGQKFKIAGTRLNYYSDPIEDAWIMERDL